jgi:preprotein translocase subunit SecE
MTAKKSQSQQNEKSTLVKSGDFLGDMKSEFKKITWTEPDALRTYTKVVVGATFAVGLGIYLVDLGIQLVLATLEFIVKGLIG